eukprot:5572005-Amphidinium_carterae.1
MQHPRRLLWYVASVVPPPACHSRSLLAHCSTCNKNATAAYACGGMYRSSWGMESAPSACQTKSVDVHCLNICHASPDV